MAKPDIPKLKPYHCKGCRNQVGETDGESIYLDGKLVPMNPTRIRFPCPFCKYDVEWRKLTEK